jgi:hypothetical protein
MVIRHARATTAHPQQIEFISASGGGVTLEPDSEAQQGKVPADLFKEQD